MEHRLPVSVKGVLIEGGAVVLLQNERDEWELPGGRLEVAEAPEACVVREFREEVGASVQVGPILDSWVYEVLSDRFVFIVTYAVSRCGSEQLSVSSEHKRLRWWPVHRLPGAELPEGYRRSIAHAVMLMQAS